MSNAWHTGTIQELVMLVDDRVLLLVPWGMCCLMRSG